jgi:hypothetical protein
LPASLVGYSLCRAVADASTDAASEADGAPAEDGQLHAEVDSADP